MAPKPAVVEEQPINAIPYYPAQQQQQFQANYNPNPAWYQQAPSLQPNFLIPNIQEANNISHNGGIITEPIRRLKIQLTNLSGLTCCCFISFLFFAAIVGTMYFEGTTPYVETNFDCYYTDGKADTISYESNVFTDYSNDAGYYAQSSIRGSLSSTDVIACSLTTNYNYVSNGYFIFYFSYETYDLCLDFESEPSTATRCTTSEAIQYTEPCDEISSYPAGCTNMYVIMNNQDYQNSDIYITTAQGVSESYVAFTLDYTLVFDIEERGTPFFYFSLVLVVLSLIFFCGACWRCVILKKKYKNALMSANQF